MTTRITVTLGDQLAELIRTYAAEDPRAKGNVSDWVARACRSRMLAEEARALAQWQREHPEETAEFYREREAEHEAMHAAESHRHGDAA
ncbi:hypothetical protein AB0H49_34090 [Nocardia sp. NPDC050713]|uniref:hypothetical protein n=1 Tax=Nocardia sp. NPDC050713 TaxID=3154511 RepID=UPI00340E1604